MQLPRQGNVLSHLHLNPCIFIARLVKYETDKEARVCPCSSFDGLDDIPGMSGGNPEELGGLGIVLVVSLHGLWQ